jgi:hypothetical protein
LPPHRWFFVVFFLVSFGVRLFYSHTLFLNPDECLHVNAGSSAQWAVYHHPPLLLWWLWAATLVSNQEWWLRLAPCLAGAITPIAAGLWLHRWMHPAAAWGLASLLAFTPNLVLLSIQLRGYSMALLGIAMALYALDRAFAETSRRWLLIHFAALAFAILAEFMTAWVALAMGLYGLLRLLRERETRSLAPVWFSGQTACLGLYVVLYLLVVRPIVEQHTPAGLVDIYLRGAFPRPGESLLRFTAIGSFKQVVYITGSMAGGAVATAFLLLGLFHWSIRRDSRVILITALVLTVLGAIGEFFPYGRSRHTVALGLLSLAAAGAGLEVVARRWAPIRWAAPAAILALAFLTPLSDVHNLPLEVWNKQNWDRSIAHFERLVPRGATVLADGEALQMLQARLAARNDRARHTGEPNTLGVLGITMVSPTWDWPAIPDERVTTEASRLPEGIWLLDTGFNVGWARTRWRALGVEVLVDEPGVFLLGRLRPASRSSKLIDEVRPGK